MSEFTESLAHDFVEYLKKDSGLTASTPAAYLEKLVGIIKAAIRDNISLNRCSFVSNYVQIKKGFKLKTSEALCLLVGVARFELTTFLPRRNAITVH